MLGDSDLHELGDVEGKGEGGDWDDVNQQPPRVRHRQADRAVLVGPADGNEPFNLFTFLTLILRTFESVFSHFWLILRTIESVCTVTARVI